MKNRLIIWRSGRNYNSKAADWFCDFARFMGYDYTEVLDGFNGLTEAGVVIIPPGTVRMSNNEISIIEDAVQSGAGLLSYFDNSVMDEHGKERKNGGATGLGLSGVLGLDLVSERGSYILPVSAHHETVIAADPEDPFWDGVDLTGEDIQDGSRIPSFTSYNIRTGQAYGAIRKTRTRAINAKVLARTHGHYEYWAYRPEGDIFLAVNSLGKGNSAYISYEALPPEGKFGLIPTDMLFYRAFLSSIITRLSPIPLPRIMQMPGGITNLILRLDDAGTDDGCSDKWGDPYHDTNRVLEASPFPLAIAVVTDKVSTSLGEERLREWEAEGNVIVCHTRNHTGMNMDETMQKEDLKESKEKLERILGHPVVMWSIPGSYHMSTENTMRLVAEAGYELSGEWVSLVADFISPDACPLYPYITYHNKLGVYVDILTASGWPAIKRDFNCFILDELIALGTSANIPCMVEFVTHVPQGLPEHIEQWKTFMRDITARVEQSSIRISTLAEQLEWATVRKNLCLTSHADGDELILSIKNKSMLPVHEVAIECAKKVLRVESDPGEVRRQSDTMIVITEIRGSSEAKIKVAFKGGGEE